MPLEHTPYPHTINALSGPTAPQPSFLVFYSDIVDGQMWCPDCRDVEGVVKAAFEGKNKPNAVIYWVGQRAAWRDPQNHARTAWNVQSIPTIIRLNHGQETGRLVEREILDADALERFVAGQ